MFSSCLTDFVIRSVPASDAIAFCVENANADAIIPTNKINVRTFMFNPFLIPIYFEFLFRDSSLSKSHGRLCVTGGRGKSHLGRDRNLVGHGSSRVAQHS